MAQDIYEAIQAHAAAGSPAAAGNLHEEIWVELLRRSDPSVHNVRVTAGDGGIDGVGFQDPVTGIATVYQCKFFKDIAAKNHRQDIVEAFVRACSHPFVCSTWVLLLPRQLSAPDLGWLMTNMRQDALNLAAEITKVASAKAAAKKASAKKAAGKKATAKKTALPRIAMPPDIVTRLNACGIRYKEGQDLEDLLRRNLDVAGRFLPESALALMDKLTKERGAFDLERRNAWDLVTELRAESIRTHQIEARRANAAIGILNQGWGGMVERLRLTSVDERLPGAHAAQVAADVEALAGARSQYAFQCEGLVPGVSDTLSEIFFQARMLQGAAGLRSIGVDADDGVKTTAKTLRDTIQKLQQQIATFTRAKVQSRPKP